MHKIAKTVSRHSYHHAWITSAHSFTVFPMAVSSLMSVLNAAVCLVTGMTRCEHIQSCSSATVWLPVRQLFKFKLAVLVYKSLHSLAPQNMVYCHHVANCHSQTLLHVLFLVYRGLSWAGIGPITGYTRV